MEKEASLYLSDMLADVRNFQAIRTKGLFDIESLDECEIFDESENHLIGEIDAIRGVISGIKSVSAWSYILQRVFDADETKFFNSAILPSLLEKFPDKLSVTYVNNDIILYNPSNKFSIFCKNMIASVQTGEYNFDPNIFGKAANNALFDLQIIKSIILGYGLWSTVCYTITSMAFNIASDENPTEDDDELIKRAVPILQRLRLDDELIKDIVEKYNYCDSVVQSLYKEFK